MEIFGHGQKQDIQQILASRDRRVELQQRLVEKNPQYTLVSAKLNIPGPIKNSKLITQFFIDELLCFEHQLQQKGVLYKVAEEWLTAASGPERFYLIKLDSFHVKQLTTQFEESAKQRRLFDLDVLTLFHEKVVSISREQLHQDPRKCLLCDQNAKECARSRKHSLEELQSKITTLISETLISTQKSQVAYQLSQIGVKAMIDEVTVWPKPGLVDPLEHGSHPDMDHFLFIKSALAIQNYLEQCACVGLNYHGNSYQEVFEELRTLGKRAEKTMFATTANVNTHKGVVFSLGIMTAAVSIGLNQAKLTEKNIQNIIQKMLANLIKEDFSKQSTTPTAGEKQYYKYKLGGIRAEAAAGYPVVFDYGLKTFNIAKDLPLNDRYIVTLMQIARHTEDSTLIKRAKDLNIIEWKNCQIDHFFDLGATLTEKGREFLAQLQVDFTKRNLSLGGSADLLILTIFVDEVERIFKDGLYHK